MLVAGHACADGADRRREMSGAAVGKIVAIDRGHHDMGEAERGDGLSDAGRLARIERVQACRSARCRRRKRACRCRP